MHIAFEDVYIPDTTVIVERTLSKIIDRGLIRGRILIPKEYIQFFESKARRGSAIGILGLEELVSIRNKAIEGKGIIIDIIDSGYREIHSDIEQERLDDIAMELARKLGAKLLTHDRFRQLACKAIGVEAMVLDHYRDSSLWFEKYFDRETLSLHIKEGAPILAKKGMPGNWRLVVVEEKIQRREDLEMLFEEIIRRVRAGEGVMEIERQGLLMIQLKDYRIIIVSPPIGMAYEITITRPITRLKLEDYELPPKLIKRLEERAEGILIAGAPGMGKTTFAQALAEYYDRKGKIVKTIESPRDMKLPPTVSQYSKSYASSRELHDILLLSRPDYTVFDEMRDDEDFRIYVDLRLAGIGMIGVVHATSPIDAIQRFIGRVDIGMIPSVIDTVIFIDRGRVTKVYEISLTVKLPTGLREADLARPVVEVRDFLSGELEYEIYVFGEQTVIVPVKKIKGEIASDRVMNIVKKIIPYADVVLENDTIIISLPRTLYTNSTMKLIRKVKKRLDRLGYNIDVKLI